MKTFLSALILFAVSLGLTPSAWAQTEPTCSLSACHRSLKGFKEWHKPVIEMKCLNCHNRTGNHPIAGPKETMTLLEKQPGLCFRCHSPFQKKVLHKPVKEGACLSCHRPHGAPSRYLIDTTGGQTPFCTGCHDGEMFSRQYVHPPVAKGECTACHDPHQAQFRALLRDGVPALCLQCHADVMKKLQGAPVVHPPVRDGRCIDCHDPHSSPGRYLLKGRTPILCTGCHVKIAKTVAAAKSEHAPIQQPGGCISCHSGHTSPAKGLLPAEGKDVCLRCHAKIAATYEGKRSVHGPIKEGKCVPCHEPHGTTSAKLLKGSYPQELYANNKEGKGAYEICMNCHKKGMLTFPDTSIYTNFRNGKQNLHYFHITSLRKGRSCRLCHEPHGSDNEHLITGTGAAFGKWSLPIGFVATPTGGRCSPGCHGTYSYDRTIKK